MKFRVGDFFVMFGGMVSLTGVFLVYPPAALILGGLGIALLGYLGSK